MGQEARERQAQGPQYRCPLIVTKKLLGILSSETDTVTALLAEAESKQESSPG